jgi:hypothetical protein
METNKSVFSLIASAILVEAVITYINQFFVSGSFSWEMLFSICFGIIIAVAYNLDLPEYFEMKSSIPYIGCIITGIIISRGSNYLWDILNTVIKYK